ncbi:hypothetical protein NDI52_04325 [Leptolyngbya sp. PL-A3]|nr:DUF6671 family protein [Leptolyngbya sp. FACHB-8]MBD1913549.1 hypothetical protein [Leptolyngbya sp. FACHB-8]MBD2155880.1 hypothetical protein [Leptolyngbya sp. FACHB-16]
MGNWDFANRMAVIATMHRKEEAIAPILHQLGIQTRVPQAFNTDQFGTFTRDIKRPADQLQTAKLKIQQALELTGETLGIASEGSFGPHPFLPMLPLNRELVVLVDQESGLELVGEATSTETNFSHASITNLEQAWEFARKVGFPSHGLVVMPEPESSEHIYKGITDETELEELAGWMLARFGQIHLETDMRAMMNPTRMGAIAQATQDLVRKLQQHCPQCDYPGFDVVQRKPGLPCGLCGMPTELPVTAIYQCKQCQFTQAKPDPTSPDVADPAQCPYCNP